MPRKKIRPNEVTSFLRTLDESGAMDIRRGPADRRGMVEVRWRVSPQEEERQASVAHAARTAILLEAAFALVVIVTILVAIF